MALAARSLRGDNRTPGLTSRLSGAASVIRDVVDNKTTSDAGRDAQARHPDALSTLEHGLRVLELVSQHEGIGPKQIAADLRLPLGTTYHLVNTLLDEGYLLRVGLGDLVLGEAAVSLADRIGHRPDPFPELRPVVADLAERSGEVAVLGRLLGRECVITAVAAAPAAAHRGHVSPGDHGPVHTMALGKVLVAGLDPRLALAILRSQRLEAPTDRTLARLDDLLRELETVRSRGWAFDLEEGEPGLSCIAARVAVPGRRPATAIAVAVPPDRLRAESGALVALVTAAARRCSAVLSRPAG